MASPLVKGWLQTTVRIVNPAGETGTGFLVARKEQGDSGSIYLVTNKHVVGRDATVRAAMTSIECHLNTETPEGVAGTMAVTFNFRGGTISAYREHPDPDTDVAALNVTEIIAGVQHLVRQWVTYESFADAAKREELEITAGEEVVTIGYPLGLTQGDSNFPLLRQGMIATRIGSPLKDKVPDGKGGFRDRKLRAFLIDGASIPGSSGSPVILKPISGRVRKNVMELGSSPQVLLGILAETRYAPIQVGPNQAIPGFAGLGMAFDVETIRETIELFYP